MGGVSKASLDGGVIEFLFSNLYWSQIFLCIYRLKVPKILS